MFQTNYNGFYNESELEYNAIQAKNMYDIGLAGFEEFTNHAETSFKRFEGFIQKILREMPEIEADLKNPTSVVMEQTRANLDQVLSNQASAMASLSGGPVGAMMRNINNRSTAMYNDQMNRGRIARIQEMQQNNKLYYDVVNDRMNLVRQAQTDLSNLQVNMSAQNSRLAQAGLQSSIDATRLMVGLRMGAIDHDIQRSKQRYDWWTSMLSSETSVYQSQMNYMTNAFNTMATSEAARYDTDIKALTSVYGSAAEANRNMFASAMAGMVGFYQTNTNSRDRRDMAALDLGLDVHRLNVWSAVNAATNQANIAASSMGLPTSVYNQAASDTDDYFHRVMNEANPAYGMDDAITKFWGYMGQGVR